MGFQGRLALASIFVSIGCIAGCSSDDTVTPDDDGGSDASVDVVQDAKPDSTVKPDAGDATVDAPKDGTSDAKDAVADTQGDVAPDATDGGADADSGLPPSGSPCNVPNQIQDEDCGLCGKHYRGCLADGDGGYAWGDWGFCQNQVVNGCDPKLSYPDVACGNCGTKKQVCLPNCNYDVTQQCNEPSGACAPGSTEFQIGLSCDAGGRERTCSNQCTWGNYGSCSPGITALENRLAAGYYHTCAINNGGQLKCWGYNDYGQLGNNTTTNSSVAVAVSNLSNVTRLGNGYKHSCAATNAGAAYCWGYNTYGAIGDGTTTNRSVPTAVSGVSNAVKIDGGYYHSCALLNDGTAKCWGYNTYGQLGNGTTTNASSPVVVSGLANALDVSGGLYYHSCALINDGTVKCWGYNSDGQLGNGTTSNASTPVTMLGVSGAKQIAVGYYHTCALTQAGNVYCAGYNAYGQLGNGSTTSASTPVLATENNVVQVTVGYAHTCVLTLGGEVRCVGYNTYGQLGNGNTSNSTSFVTVLQGARSIVAGNYHTCALLSNGGVKCWGYNIYGQLGDGTTTNKSSPVDVQGL
jgi:alpha-tubulin suppressor-like RCC1 family protein